RKARACVETLARQFALRILRSRFLLALRIRFRSYFCKRSIMKLSPSHFVLWMALTLGIGVAYGEDNQAGPKKPRSFEDYTPRSLKAIAAMKPDPNNLRDKQDRLAVTADDLPSRVRVTYGGATRPITQMKKEVIRQ